MKRPWDFLQELKRRKVVRVAVVYLATAFVVLQAADIMLPRLGVPEWAMSLIVLLVVLGFPVAMVLAWALEMTPDGVRITSAAPPSGSDLSPPPSLLGTGTVAAAGLLVVLGIGLGTGWFLRPMTSPGVSDGSRVVQAVVSTRSIAVLPFVNMSDEAANEFFADGISEELLNLLVRVDDIGVASRTSSFAYKGRDVGTVAMARELNVNHILEGSVRKDGERVRITAQLIDAVEDRHLWSETYDRQLTDIFQVQEEIANAIVAALRGTLGTGQAERAVTVPTATDNLDAYTVYLEARERFVTRSDLLEAVELFERVVEMDPTFARGWEGLAAVSAVMESWDFVDRDYNALALQAADRALALDSTLSMPWAVRSTVLTKLHPADFAQSMELAQRAIDADPNNATIHLWRSISWIQLGFFGRALSDQDRCLAIDPAYQNCLRWKAITLQVAGETDLALDLLEQEVAGAYLGSRGLIFIEPFLYRDNRVAALLLMQGLGWPRELQEAIIRTRLEGGTPPDPRVLVARTAPDDGRSHTQLYMLLGAYDLALETEFPHNLVEFWDPSHAGLRQTPAFTEFLNRLGVPAYWHEHGFPPQCRPLRGNDFECVS